MTDSTRERPFEHFSTKQKITTWVSKTCFDWPVYTVHHGLLKGMKRKGGLGWLPTFVSRSIETPETVFWRNLSQHLSRKVIYDIGACHGMLTLFFAQRGGQVVAYEPNSLNRKRLETNLALNHLHNVTVRRFAVSDAVGVAQMTLDPLIEGTATIKANFGAATEEVAVTTLDREIFEERLTAPEFIKIDVEGSELDLIRGAKQTLLTFKPELFVEMHGNTMSEKRKNVFAVVSALKEHCYDIEHVETSTAIDLSNTDRAAQGHLYCRSQVAQ